MNTDTDAVRGRVGLIVPSSNTTAEPEFRRWLPGEITVHGARMALESVTVDALDAMSDDAARAAELLGHADVDAVAYACTTGSLLHGPGFDAELEGRLQAAAGVPAVATARSVVRALEALEAERIAVVTPYTADLDADLRCPVPGPRGLRGRTDPRCGPLHREPASRRPDAGREVPETPVRPRLNRS